MNVDLTRKQCIPCRGMPPLSAADIDRLSMELGGDWHVVESHHLEKCWKFKNFREALDFTNRVGELAECEEHHPDVFLAWGKVKLTLYTHKIDGLTENDFILAAKIEEL